MTDHTPLLRPRTASALLASVAMLALGACSTFSKPEIDPAAEARAAQRAAAVEWRQCRNDALELDQQARAQALSARYLAAARLIETCDTIAEPAGANVSAEEQMKALAVGILNHLKGGDVKKARDALDTFTSRFDGADLYFADGSSFVNSMRTLLGITDPTNANEFQANNISNAMKSEFRRMTYWQDH